MDEPLLLVHQQVHGYANGHQLLSSTIELDGVDQDAVDRLSDVSGAIHPGQLFDPYITAYPVPSGGHYVVARTYQDLEARRPGCVVTRSVFVPMGTWEGLGCVGGVLRSLPMCATREKARRVQIQTRGDAPASVWEPALEELVEAVFLENGRPVVFFDAKAPEKTAVRLLTVLWPAIRRRFSVCTFALGARRTDEGYFDVVFAPAEVWSRFVDLPHRRIGGRDVGRGPMHRWAKPTAVEIFRSGRPSLVSMDAVGLLGDGRCDSPTNMRVVLLWNELATRAKTSPTAVLGMLDVLRSRGESIDRAWFEVRHSLIRSLELAIDQFGTTEAVAFLATLAEKLDGLPRAEEVGHRLESVGRALAIDEPRAVLEFLTASPEPGGAMGGCLLKGLADGVSEAGTGAELGRAIAALPSTALLKMLGASGGFRELVIGVVAVAPRDWVDAIDGVFGGKDKRLVEQVRLRLLLSVCELGVATMMWVCLRGLCGEEIADLVVAAAIQGAFHSPDSINEMARCVVESRSVPEIRGAILTRIEDTEVADALLGATLRPTRGDDVEWLADRIDEPRRAAAIARSLLARCGDEDIRSLGRTKNLAWTMLSLLRGDVQTSTDEIARLLLLGIVEGESAVALTVEVASSLSAEQRVLVGAWAVPHAFEHAALDGHQVEFLLGVFGAELKSSDLISAAVARRFDTARVASNLVSLEASRHEVRAAIVEDVEGLSARLVGRRRENLGAAAYVAWSALLAHAVATGVEAAVVAADRVLAYSAGMPRHPVSPLVVTCFPVVFEKLPRGKGRQNPELPEELLYSRVLWLGRRGKASVRSRAMDRLVDVYMRSTWPPADLMVAGLAAGVGKKVAKRIRRRMSGRRYVSAILRDARRLDEKSRLRVVDCLVGES